ncbi:oxidoreductase [Cnuibacter physcomitrellae]|uniref:oxidoreductase n=1 Tax=Cnuibacter physcomitrellae TaxID=1619308 RepID=UPI002175791A|nr:oxidoreductase [Cnuibacter physcomitrellae]MCS5498227.1 oxidoreductase [Cnuibacter physcomitrellae]
MSIWFITGCTSGLGRSFATEALRRGHQVAVTARSVGAVADLAEEFPGRALPLALDVTDADQIREASRTALEHFGSIDVLVNNAGYGYRAAVEEGDADDVRRLYDTNLFGPIQLMKELLPGMRARRSGTIVNITSIGVRACPPGSAYYTSSKAALEILSVTMMKELDPLGIHVMSVEPGSFRTDFFGRSLTQSSLVIDDYEETAGKRRRLSDDESALPGDPERAAAALIDAVESPEPPGFLLLGTDALDIYRAQSAQQGAEVDAWEQLSASTDFAAAEEGVEAR